MATQNSPGDSRVDRYTSLAPVSMKALTLWQPWASLVAIGSKTIETRSWSTSYRGPLAIHAAATMPSYDKRYVKGVFLRHLREDCGGEWRLNVLPKPHTPTTLTPDYLEGDWPCPLGALVATCLLADVVPIRDVGERPPTAWEKHVAPIGRGPLWLWHGPSEYENLSTGRPTWRTTDISDQEPYGDYTPGRFAWLLSDIVPVTPPIPARGRQQLWNFTVPEAPHTGPFTGRGVTE